MKKQIQIALLALAMSPLMALAQQTFATPDQAASALVNAVTQKNDAELDKLLGDNWQQFLPPMVLIRMPSIVSCAIGR